MANFKKIAISLGLIIAISGSTLCSAIGPMQSSAPAKTNFSQVNATDSTATSLSEPSYWSSFGKDATNAVVVDSKTAISTAEMEMSSYGQEKNVTFQDPIIVGDKMYAVTGSVNGWFATFNRLSSFDLNGNLIKEVPLKTKTGFFSRICYGDGKIFVLLQDEIQAFDAKTLTSLWISPKTQGQMLSTITYHDGYIYTGTTSGGGGGTSATSGKFFCMSTKDEDTTNELEVKDYVWESLTSGYYWAGAVVVGSKIYFAGDAGILYSHHLTQDVVYDSYNLGGQVRSNLIYDQSTNRLIASTKDTQKLITIELSDNGTFNKKSIAISDDNEIGGVTGGISAWNGRIYVPSGGMHASGGLCVVDAKTLKVIYSIPALQSQSVPLITTAYANKANNYKVYVYAIDFATSDLFIFEDGQGQTTYKNTDILKSGQKIDGKEYATTTYCSSSIKTDQLGNLYFVGGSSGSGSIGNIPYALTIFKNKNGTFTKTDIENAIEILPEVDKLKYSDKNLVLATKKRYDEFVGVKSRDITPIKNADKMNNLYSKAILLTTEAIKKAETSIKSISDNVTLADESKIETATFLYGKLFDEDKINVISREKLSNSINKLFEIKNSVAGLIEKIDLLPAKKDITIADKIVVSELFAGFNALNENDRNQVTNSHKLLDAVDKLKEIDDTSLIKPIQQEIDLLVLAKNATLNDEDVINSLYKKYDALHANVKNLISNKNKLIETYNIVKKYRASVNEIDDLIWKTILPTNITLADKADIAVINAKYNALRDSEKQFVKYYSDVLDAQKAIAQLEKDLADKENVSDIPVENPNTSDTSNTVLFLIFTLSAITFLGSSLLKKKKSV